MTRIATSQILKDFAGKVRASYPEAKMWVFGSYASGYPTTESDVDVCVVIPQMEAEDRIAISDFAWEVSFDYGVHVSTVVFSQKDFEGGPFLVIRWLIRLRPKGLQDEYR